MKLKRLSYMILGVALSLGLASCNNDDAFEPSSAHTDASALVGGTYQGQMVNEDGEAIASDVVVTLGKINEANTQAVNAKFAAPSVSMDMEANFNVAKAGENRYTLSNGRSSTTVGEATRNCAGIIENNNLTFYLTLNSKYKFSTATAAKSYTMELTKTGN